jgi:hypothetical protein
MIRADSILKPIFKNLGIDDGVRLARIKNNWQKIFKKPLTLHMSPSKLTEGELLINVDSPIWIQQLSYYKREIIENLNVYGVKGVRFRLGNISYAKRHKSHKREIKELSSADTLFIDDLISKINDDTLKESVKRAIEQSLKSGKYPKSG